MGDRSVTFCGEAESENYQENKRQKADTTPDYHIGCIECCLQDEVTSEPDAHPVIKSFSNTSLSTMGTVLCRTYSAGEKFNRNDPGLASLHPGLSSDGLSALRTGV